MDKLPPLCAICDAEACERAGWTLVDFATACLAGGATFLQIRAKRESSRWLFDTTEEVLRRAEGSGALVVVNDRADVARLAGAGGVHVGQDDLQASAVRAIVGSACCVGLSTHTEAQVDAALLEPIDYLAVGPVFATATKTTGYDEVGLGRVKAAAGKAAAHRLRPVAPIAIVGIGGITLDRAGDVLAAGAQSVAVIADLLSTNDPAGRVRAYLERLHLRQGYGATEV